MDLGINAVVFAAASAITVGHLGTIFAICIAVGFVAGLADQVVGAVHDAAGRVEGFAGLVAEDLASPNYGVEGAGEGWESEGVGMEEHAGYMAQLAGMSFVEYDELRHQDWWQGGSWMPEDLDEEGYSED